MQPVACSSSSNSLLWLLLLVPLLPLIFAKMAVMRLVDAFQGKLLT